MIKTVPLPVCEGPADVDTIIAGIDGWVRSEPMRELVTRFTGRLPDGPLSTVLDYLEGFSASHWDFRAGRERAQARRPEFEPAIEQQIVDCAQALGLRSTDSPRHRRYTHLLVLGGLVRACLARTKFAARLLAGTVSATQVSAVGGFRELTAAERELLPDLGLADCRYEVDVMEAAIRRAFGVTTPSALTHGEDPLQDPNQAWRVTDYAAAGVTARVVAAPSSDPVNRRANTADTCRFWADEVVKVIPQDRVLVVTSQTYVPFQHCDAITNIGLPYGCTIDTVGLDTATGPQPRPRRDRDSGTYLQEIRSTILSMRRLLAAAHRSVADRSA